MVSGPPLQLDEQGKNDTSQAEIINQPAGIFKPRKREFAGIFSVKIAENK